VLVRPQVCGPTLSCGAHKRISVGERESSQPVAPQRRRPAHIRAAALFAQKGPSRFCAILLSCVTPMIEEDATAARTLTFLSRDRPDDIHCRPKASRRREDVRTASLQTSPGFPHPSSLSPTRQLWRRRAIGAFSVVRSEWEDSSGQRDQCSCADRRRRACISSPGPYWWALACAQAGP
jgi:hypothetical protein